MMINAGWLARCRYPLWGLVCAALCSVAAAEEPSEAATRQYAAAVALQNRGVYDLAAEEWAKFIDSYKNDARLDRAFHYLGVCYLKANQLDAAAESFKIVIHTFPKSDMVETSSLYLGMSQYTLGQSGKAELYQKAAETLAGLVAKYPQGKSVPQALFYQGECLYALGKKPEAAQAYAQLVEKYPNHSLLADALYALGVAQQESNQPEAAGKSFEQFLQKFSQNPLAAEVTMRRGETFFAAGQFDAAAKRFALAAAKPDFALADLATVREAAALVQMQRNAEAAELYASIGTKFPTSSYLGLANLSGGKCYFLADKFAQARALLAKVPENDPGACEAAHWTARSLLKENQAAAAVAVSEKALGKADAKSPFAVQLLMDQADALYDQPARRAEAVALYAALAKKHGQDALAPQALYMAGFAAMNQGDYAAALKHAQAFLAQFSSHELLPDVTFIAAESQLQLGKLAEARKLHDELLQKYPQHPDADLWKVRRGLTFYLEKKYAEVLSWLDPLVAGIRAPDVLAEAQFLVGNSQAELGQFGAAAKALEASLAAAPHWRQADDALLSLANAYRQQNQLDKAQAALRKLIAGFPQSRILDRAHYRLAEYAYLAGDFQTAATEYAEVLKGPADSPLVPGALYGQAWARLGLNDLAGAEQAVNVLLEKHAQDKLAPRARYTRGTIRQQAKNFAGASEDLRAVLATEMPLAEKSDARYVLALCQVGLKQFAEAVDTLRTLLREDQKYAGRDKVFYELAWALKSLQKEPEAAEAFTWLMEGYPRSPLAAEARFHVAEFAFQNNQFAKAADLYAAAMEQAGASALGEKAAHKQGWALYRQDQFDKARDVFARQRGKWPQGPLVADAAFMEAECLFKLKKYEEALKAYAATAKVSNPEFAALAQLHAGQAAGQLKQWDQSRDLLAKAAQQFPQSPYLSEILYEQGWAVQNLGKADDAMQVYQRVIAAGGGEAAARAQFMIGEIQFEKKEHAEALKSFIKVAYGYSYPRWQADAVFEAARCLEILGRKEQAVKQYRELLEKYPQSDKIPLARQRVEELKRSK